MRVVFNSWYLMVAMILVSGSNSGAEDTDLLAQNAHKKPVVRHVQPVRPEAPVITSNWASKMGPIDFSAMVGLYNPGTGVEALGSYRLVEGLVKGLDNTLSVETGLGYYGASQTFAGVSASYSIFQIPIVARWDLHLMDQKLIVGPRAGLAYLLGGSATVNGATYTASNAGFNFEIGAFGMYRFTDQIAARVGVTFGGFTTIQFGATYFL